MRDQKVLIFFNLEKVFLAWRNLNPWQFLEDYHSSICARTTTDTLPWQLCPVQRLPTLASWPLFHLVFLCLSSPLSLPMKQRNRDWRIRKKTYTTPKKLVLFWLSEANPFVVVLSLPNPWIGLTNEVVQRALANHKREKTCFLSAKQEQKHSCFVCFPALDTGCMTLCAWHRLSFSCVWNRLHDFPRLAPIVCFPRLPPVARFPAFATDSLFSAFATGCMISRVWHRLYIWRVRIGWFLLLWLVRCETTVI